MLNGNSNGVCRKFNASSKTSSPSLTEKYIKDCEIGRGRFAKVCKITDKEHATDFAAKIIRRRRSGRDTVETIQKEIDILSLATERGVTSIVGLRHVFCTALDVTLVLDYAAGGELFRLVSADGPLEETYVRSVVRQLLCAISFLHANSIVHLDIKPDNILLARPFPTDRILLCDFGLAKYLDEAKECRDLVGTPDYVAPEILDYEPITLAADLWSLGVVTFFLLTAISPFMGDSKEEMLSKISLVELDYADLEEEHSGDVRRFLQALICRPASARPTALQAQEHPWMKNAGPGDSASSSPHNSRDSS